jgi:hypothetical protein
MENALGNTGTSSSNPMNAVNFIAIAEMRGETGV